MPTIDWKIPVASIGGALFATAVLLWNGAHRDAKIDDHETRLAKLELRVDSQADTLNQIKVTLARVDERLTFLIEQFGRTTATASRPAAAHQ